MFDFRTRYQGRAPVTMAALGDPRVVGLAMFGLIGVAILVAIAASAIDISPLAGLVLLAGPTGAMKSVDFKELAAAKFLEAHELEADDGTVAAEDQEKYEALVKDGLEAESQAGKLAGAEGIAETARDRFSFYHGKGTGREMRWAQHSADDSQPRTLGEQFVASRSYADLREGGALISNMAKFRTDPVIYVPRDRMGAASTDVIQTESGGPANSLVVPVRLPGILPLNQRELTIRDLFPVEPLRSGDTIEYAQQTEFDPATGLAVAQTVDPTHASIGKKKQSSIGWSQESAPVRTLATWMAATRQTLADADQVRSLIDNQGRLMLRLEEEDQLLNGNGTAPNLKGIYSYAGIQLYSPSDNLDGIRRARTKVKKGISRLSATFVVLEPIDSEEFDLLKDGNEQYRGGNPIGNFNFDQSIWRLRRVESEAQAEGVGLVGAREAATIFERQPITVLTADQHSDFFVRNLVVILFEERLAFPVFFPSAFVKVLLAEWDSGS